MEDDRSGVRRVVEDGVEGAEARIDGETIRWDKTISYAGHLRTAQLLSAQAPVSDQPDEMLFIIVHQTMELWLKLVIHETRMAMDAIRRDALPLAEKALDRIATVQRHTIQSWEVLATLTPNDFLTFRHHLGKASGFQSVQYREVEFLLGNKRADLLLVHADDPAAHGHLDAVLRAPSLYDEVLRLLARSGLAIPADRLTRDWAAPYQPAAAIEDAWLAIYAAPERHWPLYALGEKLTALDYYFQEWRFKHMKTVSRVIGHRMGTGGSAGVGYLVKALDLTFFPELLSMRTRLTGPAGDRAAGATQPDPTP